MAGFLKRAALAWAVLAGAGAGSALGGGWWNGRAAYYPYSPPRFGPLYYAAPCGVMPPYLPPPLPVARPARAPAKPLVKPLPKTGATKEAKQTAEPPSARRAPIVTESRSLGGAFAEPAPLLPQGMARVGFWNITGRDITLSIDGRQRTLGKDRAVTVDLRRTFTWQVNDGALETERVPNDQDTFEVIIRP